MKLEKQAIEKEYRARLAGASTLVVTEIKGFSSQSFTRLRARLSAGQVDYLVVSNRLFRRVLDGSPFAPLSSRIAAGSAVAVGRQGLPDLAKLLVNFEQEEGRPFLRAGMWEGVVFTSDGLKRIARLPSRRELLAQVAAGIRSPIGGLVNVLGRLLPGFLSVLQQASLKSGESRG